MIYKNFQNLRLPTLGLGCMRLPGGRNNFDIDEKATEEMIDVAMQNGVNYFDTAWGYHAGNSEPVVGRILKKYPRDSFFLASKFPGYDLSNMGKSAEIFPEQLKRCRTDYFDFYLFHNVCESNIEEYLNDEKNGDFTYLLEQKKNGRIRHLGFSAHGNIETMTRFLDAYGEHMEFCQIQLNYLDWSFQDAKGKMELLKSRNIPVWVMEPVRGGKLANVDGAYADTLKALRPEASPVEWAFRFLQTLPDVFVTLSGMSDMDQLKENIRIFSEEKPLSQNEWNALLSVSDKMLEKKTLACTSCRYCTDHCPMELDIPQLIKLYNEHVFSGGGFIAPMVLSSFTDDKKPSACIGCQSCEAVCPQNIKIAQMMTDFTARLK
ncbi:MAG: aldo/keto reductase [Clostridia bacterium]|nr:aldo/keto reductase [Clostridia bacterium]